MTISPEEIIDNRPLMPAELALIVKQLRDDNKWSQATLAEIAGITERTIQRVENGEASSLDSRRAIARAFEFEDLDTFDKPWPIPNVEKLKAYSAELERTTIVLPITKIEAGRTLRTMIEGTSSYAVEEIGSNKSAAQEAFAAIVDYLSDYNDVREVYSMSQRLEVDRDIDGYLKSIADGGSQVGSSIRNAKIRFRSDAPGLEPVNWSNIYFILAPQGALPPSIRVPKKFELG
jgi:transcriptional regulator with XRE-family HTH domain